MSRDVKIISAFSLTDAEKKSIQAAWIKKSGGDCVFLYETDPKLLGGIRIEAGSEIYDGSILARMISGETKKRFISEGIIESSADGVINIRGLSDVKSGELLTVGASSPALALNLEEDLVGAVLFAPDSSAAAGALVRSAGEILSVPVGEELIGRIVDPLGKPIDGLGEIKAKKLMPIEAAAPAILDRDKVNEPLYTGLCAIDSMIPIGKGQRELIIGDRQTGKTTIAVDTIINQKGKGVTCVYVAIGQKSSTVKKLAQTLSVNGALSYTVIVSASADAPAPMQYIAPYAGCAIAEDIMYSGGDALVVYDDLSKHAVAYRAMSLLLKRPAGREAYPGDIFYLHARLLERAAKLSEKMGGGSMTALPIVETQSGDISAFIPTNIISITDGQIYLESELFNSGIRPAVNTGLSVSRVGSAAQVGAMKHIGGKLRLDLSQYNEFRSFSQFAADLDAASKAKLEQGKRITEVLKQPHSSPMSVERQITVLYIVTKELLNRIPVNEISGFLRGFLSYFEAEYKNVTDAIKTNGEVSMQSGLSIEDAVKEYMKEVYAG